MTKIRTAVVQMMVSPDKKQNLAAVAQHLNQLDAECPDLVVLPEMFICPYQASLFPDYAEAEGGDAWQHLAELAARHQIWLAAGSVPERDAAGRIYNTAYVFDRQGSQRGKHRKMHLFDISITGGQHFRESDTLTPGDAATVIDTEFGRIGLCICYDLRFPELSRRMADLGAQAVLVPAAFNMTTGPAHWEILFRARALDNQAYLVGAAPALDTRAGYHSWGHSIMTDPWGRVISQLDENPGYLVRDLDLDLVTRIRAELPLLAHRRRDIYAVDWKEKPNET